MAATCRRRGRWIGKGRSAIDWNASLLQPVIKDVASPWDEFDKGVKTACAYASEQFTALLDGISKDITCRLRDEFSKGKPH